MVIRIRAWCFRSLLLVPLLSWGAPADNSVSLSQLHALFQKGNEAFKAGKYQQAVELYEKIRTAGYESSALWYNLGVAYFKAGKLGLAVAALGRAAQLAPRDEDITYNLKYVRLFRQDRLTSPPLLPLVAWFFRMVNLFTARELGWSLGILFWLLSTTFAIWFILRRKPLGRRFLAMAIALLVLFLINKAWYLKRQEIEQTPHAVVLASEVAVHSGPLEATKVLFELHEAAEGTVVDSSADWLEIRLPDGKKGWLPRSEVIIY